MGKSQAANPDIFMAQKAAGRCKTDFCWNNILFE